MFIPAQGHEWGEWMDDENGTTHTHTCKRPSCGEEETEAHDWRPAYDTLYHWQECSGCHAKTEEEFHVLKQEVQWNADRSEAYSTVKCDCGLTDSDTADRILNTTVDPNCTEAGSVTYEAHFVKLDHFNAYITDPIPALGHDLVSHDAQTPTCTEIGWDAYDTCSRCDHTTYVEKPALGHTEAIDPDVAATCTKAGLTEGKHCSVCNTVLLEQKTVEALGHDWSEWQVTIMPQIGKAGERERTCSRCGETEKEPVAALIGYSMIKGADSSWTKGSAGSFSVTVKRSEDDENCFSHYQDTLIDGTPADVSAEAGSTVVTFSADTLEKLTAETHTVTIRFDDGEVVGKLVINEAESQARREIYEPLLYNVSELNKR